MKLLVGIDLSDYTEMIVEKAEDIARALSARVWLLHAVKPEPALEGDRVCWNASDGLNLAIHGIRWRKGSIVSTNGFRR